MADLRAASGRVPPQPPASHRGRSLLQSTIRLEPVSNPGQCLTLPGGAGAADGTQLVLAPCTGAAEQQFIPPPPGDTMYLMVGDVSWNKTMSVSRGGTGDGAAVAVRSLH